MARQFKGIDRQHSMAVITGISGSLIHRSGPQILLEIATCRRPQLNRDHDLAEVSAALLVLERLYNVFSRKCFVDDRS